MSKLVKSLLAATAFATLVPTVASARPPYCDEICTFEADCSETCWNGRISNCGAYGVYGTCGGARTQSPEVTVSEAQQSDEASLVCSEAHQSEELSAVVEG